LNAVVAPFFTRLFAKRTTLQRLGAPTPLVVDDVEGAARAIVAELRGAPIEKRVRIAREGGLPASARKLGAHAGVVLGEIFDDDLLREALGSSALVVWYEHDAPACMAHALARAHRMKPELLWQLLTAVRDASEVYEVFAPIYRSDPNEARALMTSVPFDNETARSVLADARIVDLALETMARDVRTSCVLLGLHASPRAVDELRAVLERVPADDEPSAGTEENAIAAIDALAAALEAGPFIDVLAQFLAAQPKRLVPYMYLSMRIAQYSIALDQHPLVRANPSLRTAVEQTAWPPPLPAG
jgi:hypothetical protein